MVSTNKGIVQQYAGLVTFFAKKYERPGATLDREELMQEGYLVLARCMNKYSDKPKVEFDKLLKTSLNNHLMSLSIYHTPRNAQMVDLDEEFENVGRDQFEELYIKEVISHLLEILAEMPRKVLREMLEPSAEVHEIARIDQMRKRKLKSQGQDVRGAETTRILDKHIAAHLGIPKTMMTFYRDEIRIAAIKQGLTA
jgi:hypothetical protein